MSPGFQALLAYIILTAFFDLWYFLTRYRLRKKLIWKILFFINMTFGVLMVQPIAQWIFQSFGVSNFLMDLCLAVMAIAIILHHTSLLLLARRKKNSKSLEFIHIPLSHLLLGVPYVLTAIIGAVLFYPGINSNLDTAIYIVWFSETAVIGVVTILIGLGILKAHRKW